MIWLDKEKCNHKYNNDKTALMFDVKNKCMVYPIKYYGYCDLCKKSIEVSKDEFEKLNNEWKDD